MIYLVAALLATSVGALIFLVAQLLPSRPAAISARLSELERVGTPASGALQRRNRQARREQWETVLQGIGERVQGTRSNAGATQQMLIYAGFRGPAAIQIYRGLRVALPLGLFVVALVLGPMFGAPASKVMMAAFWMGAIAWVVPSFYVGRRARARQKEVQLALADTLDLLVVCVEAGLGLNQAMMRVSEEIRHVSTLTSQELALVNLEIRAGVPREEALRNLGERTGVEDLRSLVAMLIQTDRFGTSVAQALRVHSDTLRSKRRQRAEEAAAKTTIKMLFPLVFFIFPAMFVVILGPAVIQILASFSGLK